MSEKLPKGVATVAQLAEFDAIIDARSPGEFAEDRLPGAISMPVLDDEQRARVGTLYKQVSAFEAKKLGAALVSKNIARHIERTCWTSPKLAAAGVLLARRPAQRRLQPHPARNRLGRAAPAGRLQGLAPARHRTTGLLPPSFRFRVVSGATGSGKSRLLEAIAARGGQVLHLEELAAHKGSVLGSLPDTPQPAQKGFESQLLAALSALDPARPVFVEAESRKIGRLQVPDALLAAIRGAPGLRIEAPLAARVEFLLRDYDYAVADPAWLVERLGHLRGLQSNETLAALANADRRRGVPGAGGRTADAALRSALPALAGAQLRLVWRGDPLHHRATRRGLARPARRGNPRSFLLKQRVPLRA
jgi:tRNA 2-selenouridine synthase